MSEPRQVHHSEHATLWHGDCIETMKLMPDNSVDAVVTDPPYGLEFMGAEWDSFKGDVGRGVKVAEQRATEMTPEGHGHTTSAGPYLAARVDSIRSAGLPFQQWCQQWAAEALRVLKPGGHLLAFGGTRTFHRLASGIEDAGFEIRDSIAWLYGSGFPKSMDVSKAIDKLDAGEERLARARRFQDFVKVDVAETASNTEHAREWEGWGTALKPAFEPVVVARKPFPGTVAANVLAHGTGALNIDATRIETAEKLGGGHSTNGQQMQDGWERPWMSDPEAVKANAERSKASVAKSEALGRWPANVILDESQAAELDRQAPSTGGSGQASGPTLTGGNTSVARGKFNGTSEPPPFYDEPLAGASRFFYVAKAPGHERPVDGEGTAHPTVKPVSLMRWLVKLVTPHGGTVLEPFAGSGTTIEAALTEGFHVVAIEREAKYIPLCEKRMARPMQGELF